MLKVLQLSVLDPVLHTRLFYKIACSLRNAGCEVSIVGTDRIKNTPETASGIRLIALPLFNRNGFTRFFRPFTLLKIAVNQKPDVLVVHSPELLMIAVFYKLFFWKKILVYDVLEDYRKNLKYHPFMRPWKKRLLSFAVAVWEGIWTPFFDHIWYAELCYENSLNVPPHKIAFLLNRFTANPLSELPKIPLPEIPYMVCTGTLNRTWGVQKTLTLWEAFNKIKPLHLIISGFTFDVEVLPEITAFVEKSGLKDRITMVGINEYVPYPVILHYIHSAIFGTGLYDLPPSIQGKIPTKFYEFLALQKPLLFTDDNYWNTLNETWNFGISIRPEDSPETIWKKLQQFKPDAPKPEIYSWEENEDKIIRKIVETWKKTKENER